MEPSAERPPVRERRQRLRAFLAEQGLFAAVLGDWENERTANVRYLSGHPSDAFLFLFSSGRSVLVPWDVNLAGRTADVDEVIPYADFKRNAVDTVLQVLKAGGLERAKLPKVEFSARSSHLRVLELRESLKGAEVVVRAGGIDGEIARMRAVKDAWEIGRIRRASAVTDALLSDVEALLGSRGGVTEYDAAALVEKGALARGAEAMGFTTLAAGPARSWAIHAFPAYSGGPFGAPGLSILDFGVKVDGYTSDVTVTVARGRLSPAQEGMLSLVQEAHDAVFAVLAPGADPKAIAQAAEDVLSRTGRRMPHSLGHGIGLDAHEGPSLSLQGRLEEKQLLPGMVCTVEPGLYDPAEGGVRLENDALITPRGAEKLTKSRILRLP
jgi:Xaa-Pro dipeptidase